jgi:integrase
LAGGAQRVELLLGPTKADQEGRNPAILIAAVPAVTALWRWCHERRDSRRSDVRPALFATSSGRQLSKAALCEWLDGGLQRAGHRYEKITGRCFRRGAATALIAGGAAPQAVGELARWGSEGVMVRYLEAEARRSSREARVIALSESMAPPAPAAPRR